jgi:hypothetical protein
MFIHQVVKKPAKEKKITSKPTNHTYQENPNSPQIGLILILQKKLS